MRFFIFFSFAASNVSLENAKVTSCDTMAIGLSPSNNGVTVDRISNSTESSEVKNERDPVSETEKDASLYSAGKLSRETDDQSLPMAETCNAKRHSEVQTAVASGVNQESSRGMEVDAVICDIAAEVVDAENASLDVSGG